MFFNEKLETNKIFWGFLGCKRMASSGLDAGFTAICESPVLWPAL